MANTDLLVFNSIKKQLNARGVNKENFYLPVQPSTDHEIKLLTFQKLEPREPSNFFIGALKGTFAQSLPPKSVLPPKKEPYKTIKTDHVHLLEKALF